jgi:hypothetical protein
MAVPDKADCPLLSELLFATRHVAGNPSPSLDATGNSCRSLLPYPCSDRLVSTEPLPLVLSRDGVVGTAASEVRAKNGFGRFWRATEGMATSPHPPASHGSSAAARS